MSVVWFSAEELGNAAAYLLGSRYGGSARHVEQVVEDLAAYSMGNTWAYNHQYGETLEPVSMSELARAATRLSRTVNREQAKGTLRLLAYNGITNAGAETRLTGYHEAMSRLMAQALARVSDELNALREEA